MPSKQRTGVPAATQSVPTDDPDSLRWTVERVVQGVLEADAAPRAPAAHLHADPDGRSANRRGHRNGH